jgi:hypothetical protein
LLSETGAGQGSCECKYKSERAKVLHGRNCEPSRRRNGRAAGPKVTLQTRFFGPFAIAVLTESRNCLGLKSVFPRGNA